MRKCCFVFVLALLPQTSWAMMEEVKHKEKESFYSLLEAVRGGDSETAVKLIKNGTPAAFASNISQELVGIQCKNVEDPLRLTIICWNDGKLNIEYAIVEKKLAKQYIEIFTDLLQEGSSRDKIRWVDESDASDDEPGVDNKRQRCSVV